MLELLRECGGDAPLWADIVALDHLTPKQEHQFNDTDSVPSGT